MTASRPAPLGMPRWVLVTCIVATTLFAVAGLAILAFFVLFFIGMSNWGSNK